MAATLADLAIRRLVEGRSRPGSSASAPSPVATASLTADETMLLSQCGVEPLRLVFGVAAVRVGRQRWSRGGGELHGVVDAVSSAWDAAFAELASQARDVSAAGVVSVRLDLSWGTHRDPTVQVDMVGTAVRHRSAAAGAAFFTTEMRGQQFLLLHRAGLWPASLVMGCSVVRIPWNSTSTAFGLATRGGEATGATSALYGARELAMARLQDAALRAEAHGVLDLRTVERPGLWGRHSAGFVALGTAVRELAPGGAAPSASRTPMAITLNDRLVRTDPRAITGERGGRDGNRAF